MSDQRARLMCEINDAGSAVVVMSPHLDDAVLSCGALLAHLAPRHPITVVTAFTAAAPPPWSLPARRHLHAIGMADAEFLFGQRQAEDREVLAGIGAMAVHLGLRDALFRRVGESARGLPGPGRLPDSWRQWGRWRPQSRERWAYPTFRFDAARGRVASCDAGLPAELSARVGEIARASGAKVVFAPLGIGRHVDHLIMRRAAQDLGLRTVYYSDFPYSETAVPEPGFVRRAGLIPHPWLCGRAENANRIAGYRTQFAGLFPDGTVPTRPEIYWIAANDSATAT
jgi:LmbE family N-acetylglucosaminyl deacetylase